MPKKILFTGGGGAGTGAIWRLLSKDYELFFADASIEAIDNNIPEDRKVRVPFASDVNFIPHLKKICFAKQIDIVVPGVDEELQLVCQHRDQGLPEVFLPSSDFVTQMLDKFVCAENIRKAGLSVPLTLPVNRANEIGFPLILKPRMGRGSRGVLIVHSIEEIEAYKVLNKVSEEDLLVQELGIGREYTIFVSGDAKGELTAIIPVYVEQKRGITIRAHTEVQDILIEYIRSFQSYFKERNVYNVQCILTEDNRVLPFEVNPRISTTFCLGLAAGYDPFEKANEKHFFIPRINYSLKRNWYNDIEKMKS